MNALDKIANYAIVERMKGGSEMRTIEYNNYQGLETIRIQPENYCLAAKEKGKWERFRDAACDKVWEAIDNLGNNTEETAEEKCFDEMNKMRGFPDVTP